MLATLLLIAPAANFVCDDAEVAAAAEAARVRSAVFWTGRPLPGDWSAPCPIAVTERPGGAGGATSFRFDRGRVGGWRMTLQGPRAGVLADAVPHEVDHMVRASLVRRPVARWLDEGCAALMESPAEHARLRREARRFAASGRPVTFFGRAEYPRDPRAVTELYAVGFALCERLVRRLGPATVLDAQRSAAPERALAAAGWPVERLVEDWRASADTTDCSAAGCVTHGRSALRCRTKERPTLTVRTAAWCGACRRFAADRRDPAFAALLAARVHVHVHPAGDAKALPTFTLNGRELTGYAGKAWLLARIDAELRRGRVEREAVGERAEPVAVPSLDEPTSPEADPSPPLDSPPPSLPRAQETSASAQEADAPRSPTRRERLVRVGGVALTVLEAVGLAGGAAATGGLGAALVALLRVRRRLRADSRPDAEPRPPPEDDLAPEDADLVPLPRELDEARELLALRNREGRVAALDALRGMVLDDELERLAESHDAEAARRLRALVDDRVAAIAPLSVRRE